MTLPTQTEAVQMPLPVVGYLNIKACMPRTLDFAGTPGALRTEPLCKVSDAQAYAAQKVFHPSNPPTWCHLVLCMTDDADGDLHWVIATYNDEKIGYLGIGGRRVKPIFGWAELLPLVRPSAALNKTKE